MRTFYKRFILISVLLFLVGCERMEIKRMIQQGLDEANPHGNTGVCFVVGEVSYPYTSKELDEEPDEHGIYDKRVKRNNILNKRLPVFAQLGLLTETPVLDESGQQTGFYRYDLTDEGKKYTASYLNKWQTFCFGRVIVDSVLRRHEGITSRGSTLVVVSYDFHIEGEIPQWATSVTLDNIISVPKDKDGNVDWSRGSFAQHFLRNKDDSLEPLAGSIMLNVYGIY